MSTRTCCDVLTNHVLRICIFCLGGQRGKPLDPLGTSLGVTAPSKKTGLFDTLGFDNSSRSKSSSEDEDEYKPSAATKSRTKKKTTTLSSDLSYDTSPPEPVGRRTRRSLSAQKKKPASPEVVEIPDTDDEEENKEPEVSV